VTKILLYISVLSLLFNACKTKKSLGNTPIRNFESSTTTPVKPPNDEYLLEVSTDYGTMKVRLYNGTPLHRDNMLKLIKQGYFDSLLFHRVIKNFVIQGGDPDSKNAEPNKQLGEGGPGYTIPAEFLPKKYFHKKGALAAARENDDVNPKKESSGSQFYFVQGKIQDDALLEKNEKRINRGITVKITDSILSLPQNHKLKSDLERIKSYAIKDSLPILQKLIDQQVDPIYARYPKYKIPEDEKIIYRQVGGTPHLDSQYTVFGEIYEGLDVLDKIISVETDQNDRPKKDVRMKIKILRTPL
jgi:peptidylprolyl isomerase